MTGTGRYIHNQAAGSFPDAASPFISAISFATTSVFEVQNTTNWGSSTGGFRSNFRGSYGSVVLNYNTAYSAGSTLAGATLAMSGNLTVKSGTTFRMTTSQTAYSYLNVGGNVTVENSAIFVGTSSTGAGGSITVSGDVTTSGTGYVAGCAGSGGSCGKIVIGGSLNGLYKSQGPDTLQFSGGSGTPTWTAISGSAFRTVIIGENVNLGAAATVGVNLTLTSGNITTTSTNLLTLGAGAIVGGGSASSFVNGPMATTGTGTLTYPVGAGTAYRPVVLGSVLGTSPIISVQVSNGNPGGTVDGTLHNISTVRYWAAVLASGTFTSGTVNLTYNTDDGVTDYGNLLIGSQTSSGANGTYSTTGGTATGNTSGSITSSSISSIGGPSTPTFFVLANNTVPGTNPLPVEMTSFSASSNRLTAELQWSTATEVNNFGFEIERKTSNDSWTKIGFVAGAGTSTSLHNYSYVDNTVDAGLYQYRIKQIDKNGTFKYSSVMQVETGLAPKILSLGSNYPNPFNPSTSIEFSVPVDGRAALKVYNMLGQEVATLFDGVATAGKLMKVTFDASRLTSGVYFSRLESGGHALVTRMLLMK